MLATFDSKTRNRPEMKMQKDGPLTAISRVITSLVGVKSPQLPVYKTMYRCYNSIYNDRRVPSCTWMIWKSTSFKVHIP